MTFCLLHRVGVTWGWHLVVDRTFLDEKRARLYAVPKHENLSIYKVKGSWQKGQLVPNNTPMRAL